MQIDVIESLASKNKPLFPNHSVAENFLYTSLRALYSSYHKGEINRDNAKIEKAKIIRNCQELEEMYSQWCSVYQYYQDNIRKAGTLLSRIEKSSDIKEIALLACEAIQCMTGEMNFLKRQKKKLRRNSSV